jgi:hypothetical protein
MRAYRECSNGTVHIYIEKGDQWPGAVPDGLSIPCQNCGKIPVIDYSVKQEIWKAVVPPPWRPGVVCVSCFIKMAKPLNIDLSEAFVDMALVTQTGQTIIFKPETVWDYREVLE